MPIKFPGPKKLLELKGLACQCASVKIGKPGLQGKFIIALLVAAALPFLAGLIAFETIGYRVFLAERGKLHQTEAMTVARALDQASHANGNELHTWFSADTAALTAVAEKNQAAANEDPARAALETRRIDAAWPSLAPDDPLLVSVIENPAAHSLVRFRQLHPDAAEILLTDMAGRLVAATGKSSDYDQSDEKWWQDGAALPQGGELTDVLRFDESSGVFSLDVILPLHDKDQFAGVAKLSVDVTALFARLASDDSAVADRCEILLPDGRILASSKRGFISLAESMPPENLGQILGAGNGWTVIPGRDGEAWMTGFVALASDTGNPNGYVMFQSPRDNVIAPMRRNFLQLGAAGVVLLLVCAFAGFHLIRRDILKPLSLLGSAARSISATAKLNGSTETDNEELKKQRALAEKNVEEVLRIRTGDEIQALAGDLAVMTSRVLRYHRELETEVSAKTAVIREDLELAREFQNALLPSRYPQVPPPGVENPLKLEFSHFYQPASTVGGDFFDFLVLNDNCAGILIADVMGHGARSALITAILRALVRTHSDAASDPGLFLTELNNHLHEVVSRSDQTLFVTAFFLMLDTRNGRASWAVAGHPAPLVARRGSDLPPKPLWTESQRQPALGLIPNASFRTSSAPLGAGDVFLLFTDGAIEAENPEGENFGVERLSGSLAKALSEPLLTAPARIVNEVTAFQLRSNYDDDVCLVVVEAKAAETILAANPQKEPVLA